MLVKAKKVIIKPPFLKDILLTIIQIHLEKKNRYKERRENKTHDLQKIIKISSLNIFRMIVDINKKNLIIPTKPQYLFF